MLNSESRFIYSAQFNAYYPELPEALWLSAAAQVIYFNTTHFWLSDDKLHLLMPLYTTNLGDYIEKERSLFQIHSTAEKLFYRLEAAYIVYQILTCLRHLHVSGAFHGDLHAKNVLVNNKGQELDAIVTDFGLSRNEADSAETDTSSEIDESSPYRPAGGISRFTDLKGVANIYDMLLKGLNESDFDTASMPLMRLMNQATPVSDDQPTERASSGDQGIALLEQWLNAVNESRLISLLRNADQSSEEFTAGKAADECLAVIGRLYVHLKFCNGGKEWLQKMPFTLLATLRKLSEEN